MAEFRAFLMLGNILDLAVAFIMGVAFASVVQSLVNDIIMQLIAAIFGKPDFSALSFTLNNSEIRYGAFLTALLVFVQVALAVFLILKAVEKARRSRKDEEIVEPEEEIVLLRDIRDALVAGRASRDVPSS